MKTRFYLEVLISETAMAKGFKLTQQMLDDVAEVVVPKAELDEVVVRPIKFASLKTRLENIVKTTETVLQSLKGLTGD
jgi:hypothetical protein